MQSKDNTTIKIAAVVLVAACTLASAYSFYRKPLALFKTSWWRPQSAAVEKVEFALDESVEGFGYLEFPDSMTKK